MIQERLLTRYSTSRLEGMDRRLVSKQKREMRVAVGVLGATKAAIRSVLAAYTGQDVKEFNGDREATPADFEVAINAHEALDRWYALNERRTAIDLVLTRRGSLGGGNV